MADSEEDRKLTVEEKAAHESGLLDGHDSPTDTKVKPALKKKNPRSGEKPKKALKWDEVAIEEHDLLRGTRMKIDEPNTPYVHYDSGQESDDSRRAKSPVTQKNTLSWDSLQNRLDSVAAVQDAFPSSPSSHGGDPPDEDDDRQKEMRKLEFREHRKRHYNEMELVRQFRQEHPDGVDIGADADDEEEN
ncbi:expressed unknown protein [Seminavis robusta]|uniref:Protein phosphatase inhibitor 2 n=2 Tax=Seminavis robusta TaxID=568900 RepID=A0A9N8E8U8_9STRA|nr:expressed unknown protein [Seminavis robusta]|eukprot:Sro750_g196910.1 n/a (189) ;mRNA; r:9461-10027